MDLGGPVHTNLQSVVKDLEAITKEMIAVAVQTEKNDDNENKMSSIAKLYAKKQFEFKQLLKEYRIRLEKKKYIEELQKVKKFQDKKLEIYGSCFQKIYDKMRDLERRVDVLSNESQTPIDAEDIVRASYLYSKAHSAQAPDKKAHYYRPYPTVDELQKGRLMQIKKKILAAKHQQEPPNPDYIPSSNPVSLEAKEAWERYHQKFCASTMIPSSVLEKYYQGNSKAEESKKKKTRFWSHYRKPCEPITVAPWQNALAPQGTIEGISMKNYGRNDEGTSSSSGNRRPNTPEYPPMNFISMQEKHSIYFQALNEDGEKDLFMNEEPLNPLSIQSSDLVQSDNLEHFERYQEITEHERQKYYNSFNEESIPWLQKPGKEKYKKKPNQRFRLTTPAFFGEQQRITKRIVWNAKYNRFYRNYKYRVPRLCDSVYNFPNPRRQEDPRINLNQAEYCWNLRKWTLQATVSTPNA